MSFGLPHLGFKEAGAKPPPGSRSLLHFFFCSGKLFLKLNLDRDLKNHWLAGFSNKYIYIYTIVPHRLRPGGRWPRITYAASFQIKVLNSKNRTEIRLNFRSKKKKSNAGGSDKNPYFKGLKKKKKFLLAPSRCSFGTFFFFLF